MILLMSKKNVTYFNFKKTLLILLTVVCIKNVTSLDDQSTTLSRYEYHVKELLAQRVSKDNCEVFTNSRLYNDEVLLGGSPSYIERWERVYGVLGVTIGFENGYQYYNGAINCIEVAKKIRKNYRKFNSCQHVVIAAHLVDSQDITSIQVCITPHQSFGECPKYLKVDINIDEGIIIHPDYDPDLHLNDIALLELPYNINQIVKDEDGDEDPYLIEPWTKEVMPVGTILTGALEAVNFESFYGPSSIRLSGLHLVDTFPTTVEYYYIITWAQAIKSTEFKDKCRDFNQSLVKIFLPTNVVLPHTEVFNCPFTEFRKLNKRQSGDKKPEEKPPGQNPSGGGGSSEQSRPDLFVCLDGVNYTAYDEFGFLVAKTHGFRDFIVGHFAFYDKKPSKPVVRVTQLYHFKPWMDYVGLQVFLPEDQRRKGLRFKKWTKKPKTSTEKQEDIPTERSKPDIYYDDANAYKDVVFARNPCQSGTLIVSPLSYGHPFGVLSAFAVIAMRSIMF